jgi:DNA processing protein
MRVGFSQLDAGREAELWATLTLLNIRGLGAAARKSLVDAFASPAEVVAAAGRWEEAVPWINPGVTAGYERGDWRETAEKQLKSIQACQAGFLLYTDPLYPLLLREIPDSPLLLFYLGDTGLLSRVAIAVVGARLCTEEGMSVAASIVRGLTRAGVATVSGLALGIDRVAHLAGLEGEGRSIAVLGSGIDVPYPRANLDLYDLMAEKGLILSEFLPGTAPLARNFPIRNRIISGLSRGVLVVEAAVHSGTLITARHAVEQNREVFAVPGSTMADTSEGCRDLIRRGAGVVFAAEDILLELAPFLTSGRGASENNPGFAGGRFKGSCLKDELRSPGVLPWNNAPLRSGDRMESKAAASSANVLPEARLAEFCADLAPEEGRVLKFLNQRVNCHIDGISEALALDAARASGILAMLEVRGLVRRHPGMIYSLS